MTMLKLTRVRRTQRKTSSSSGVVWGEASAAQSSPKGMGLRRSCQLNARSMA